MLFDGTRAFEVKSASPRTLTRTDPVQNTVKNEKTQASEVVQTSLRWVLCHEADV